MNSEATYDQKVMLAALNILRKHIYEGTVPAKVIAKRRAKNKVAKKSRRVNRER